MFRTSLAFALIAFAAVAAPAQSSPSPAPQAAAAAPHAVVPAKEDLLITAAAKTFYAQIRDGKVDRTKLGPELNSAMSEDTTQLIGSQLAALGPPKWEYVGYLDTATHGRAHVYNLTFADAAFRLLYGAKDGIVNVFALSPRAVAAKP
jgi:hypothetical protein